MLFHTSIFQNECTFLREILSIIDIDFVWGAIHPLYLWCGQLLNKAVLREQIMARLRNMCEPASTGDPTRSCRDSISDKEMIYANQTQPTVTRSWVTSVRSPTATFTNSIAYILLPNPDFTFHLIHKPSNAQERHGTHNYYWPRATMMSKPLSYGLNLSKKSGSQKPNPAKRRPVFGDDGDSDDDDNRAGGKSGQVEVITEIIDAAPPPAAAARNRDAKTSSASKPKSAGGQRPLSGAKPSGGAGKQVPIIGDLSSALTARKHAQSAEKEDPSIYDYDAAYDSFKAAPAAAAAAKASAADRRPQYMANLKKMAEVRERDRKIAEDKKMKREREAEGDEFAGKDMFVTEAYKKQQEENRRLEEEEKRREEAEDKKNEAGGMTGFYKRLLDQGDKRHAEMMKAAEEAQKNGGPQKPQEDEAEEKEKTDVDMARELNEKGAAVAINDDGQVVDKRQLLKGGLNLGAKKKTDVKKDDDRDRRDERDRRDHGSSRGYFGGGGKQAMRDRQSRMMEAQYEQALKRSREEAEEERKKIELVSKSRKTESDISSAKERYLARKRAEAEAKKNGAVDP